MIWLTWRQLRTRALVSLIGLAAVTAAFAATGPHLADLYDASGLADCAADCDALRDGFLQQANAGVYGGLAGLGGLLLFGLPAVVGIFWGAPLVARELETGTYRLAWNQSVTRTRWLAAKLLGAGATTAATAAVLSLAVTWWSRSLDTVWPARLAPDVFAARGVVPVAYAAFAFAVGVCAGLLVRRTVPAMALTLAVVVGVQVLMPFVVRPHLLNPVTAVTPLGPGTVSEFYTTADGALVLRTVTEPGAWVLTERTLTADGHPFTGVPDPTACDPRSATYLHSCLDWVATLNLHQEVAYQPANRFWPLQWLETSLLLALTAVLIGTCFWWLRRRLT